MELRQLRCFVVTADEASFSRAAVRLHVAQPAVSQQIAGLERELGVRLFDRLPRRTVLTPAGEAFLPYARAAVEAATAGKEVATGSRTALAGTLRFGTIPSPPDLLIDQLRQLQRRHPAVRVRVVTVDPEPLVADVASGRLDVALIGAAAQRQAAGPAGRRVPAGVASATYATEPLVLTVPRHHPLTAKTAATMADLEGQPIATLTTGTGLRSVIENACADLGFPADVRAECNDLFLLPELIARGLGIGVMPQSVAARQPDRLDTVALAEPAPHRLMLLIWPRRDTSPLTRAFLELTGALDEKSLGQTDVTGP